MFGLNEDQWKSASDLLHVLFGDATFSGWGSLASYHARNPEISSSNQPGRKYFLGEQIQCRNPDGSIQFLNDATKLPSVCFLCVVGVAVSLLVIGPLLTRVWQLSSIKRTKTTILGQLSTVLALACPILFFGSYWDRNIVPSTLELVMPVAAFTVASLHYVQDGRVNVCCSEILMYWLVMVFIYLGFALDSWILFGLGQSWTLIVAFVFSIHIFAFELIAPERHTENTFDDVSIFSRLSINYAHKVMSKGLTDQINHEDLMDPPKELNAAFCNAEFQRILDSQPTNSKYRVMIALGHMIRYKLVWIIVLEVFDLAVVLLIPKITATFLQSLSLHQSGNYPIYKCYYLASLIGSLPLISLALNNMCDAYLKYMETQTRAALMTALYRKAMRLSPAAKERYSPGKIMNLMNVDTNQLFAMIEALPEVFFLPFSLIFSTWQLWTFLGPSFFTAAVVYILVTPISVYLSSIMRKIYPELTRYKDQRSKLTTNIFRCIRSLKLHAWEVPFFRRISDLRTNKELRMIQKAMVISVTLSVSWNTASNFAGVTVFSMFLWLGRGSLSPDIVFPSLYLLQLASSVVMIFPQYLNIIIRAFNSQRRINELLLEEQHDFLNYEHIKESAKDFKEPTVIVDSATISWNGEETKEKTALENVEFEATRGDLICIVGRVGSGKTAVLRALCGDLSILKGSISLKGSICYCGQEPWLQNLSVKQNILFGQEIDEDWYKQVLHACELTEDLKEMPDGDLTHIGESGHSLSGGQKARVALARAVYSRADILILDDVLSAVDEHVSNALTRKLLSIDGILANRTIILATNNVKILSHSSKIIALENKKIFESATFQDVISEGSKSHIFRIIQEFGHQDDIKQNIQSFVDRKTSIQNREKSQPNTFPKFLHEKPAINIPFSADLVGDKDEEKEVLKSYSVIKRYLYADRPWVFFAYMSIILFSVVATNSISFYLGFLANQNLTSLYEGRWYITGLFILTVVAAIALVLAQYSLMQFIGLRNSKILHDNMLWNVLHATMSFFNKTPIGRLANRFTGDLQILDDSFPTVVYYAIRSIINLVFMIIAILFGTPSVLVVIVVLGWLTNSSRIFYIPTQRKVMRITTAANSPILAQIEDSLKGRLSIQAYDKLDHFIDLFYNRIDYWMKASFYNSNLSLWLSFRLQVLTTILQLAVALASTQLVSVGVVGVSYAAVMLNLADRAGIMTQQSISLMATLETMGIALERIYEYIEIEQEAPSEIEAKQPDEHWPSHGEISYKHLSAKYSETGPRVLKDLNFKIQSGEKIGIVGRTGSGKSTLTMILFRLLEANEGHVEIDGVDTSTLGLADLRSRLSIIPQDAQIFDSTVRENLDPFNVVDDAKMWDVLSLCHLKDHFRAFKGLDTELTDSGGSLSQGQCQLLCLGRALINKSKILVLDEATSSVDYETDRLVQETIRTQFNDRTIITIAHRLNTITDSDRVIVLDNGEIVEFDTPQNLLLSKGLFYSLYHAEQKEEEQQ